MPGNPNARSFIPVPADCHFPIQNLPYGIFLRPGDDVPRVGVAIGDMVLDLALLSHEGLLEGPVLEKQFFVSQRDLNEFMRRGLGAWREVRTRVAQLLNADVPTLRDNVRLRDRALTPQAEVTMLLPAKIGNYTDFYSSQEHARNVGTMLRGPDHALQPNWVHLPVAYHGRASSIIPSGVNIHRPMGQIMPDGAQAPIFGPTRALDFELEVGFFVGPGNDLGRPISIDEAPRHIFGMVLVNDWSARDIQKWEYVPLGPFLAKNFATSISPWVVPMAALETFRTAGPIQVPEPLPYLRTREKWSFDIHLEILLKTAAMPGPQRISVTNARHLYWTICQQLAHHTVNGCNLQPGDLLASGTISGPTPGSYGSLLELAWRGTRPLKLGEETRIFLQDGDRVTMTGWCDGEGYRVGFGEVTAAILPVRSA
jgi:fumarylacetoacetase